MYRLKQIFAALTPPERLFFVGAAFAAILSGTMLGGILVKNATVPVPARGGEYVEGIVGQLTYVNPVLAGTDIDKSLVALVFASLKDLADKIEIDNNGRLWKVRLKENVFWSDGKKITSDDVIFTVQRIQDPESQSPLFLNWQGVAPRRESELELQFNLANPSPFFSEYIERLYVLPKHLFAETPPANWRLSQYNLKPIGSGPYMFSSHEKRDDGFITTYRLKENPRYFRKHPYIPSLVFRFFPNADDLLKAFNAGAVDGFATFDAVPLERVKRPHQALSFLLPSYYAVFFNQGQNLSLKDASVREALDLALDREEIIQNVFGGRARSVRGPLREETLAYSRERAIEILEAAGWKLNAEGVREKIIKNSTIKLELSLTVPEIPFLLSTANLIEAQWKEIGAVVNILTLSPEEIAERTIKNREYQAILIGNFLSPTLDLFSFWHSNNRFYPGRNLSLYNSKEADDLIDTIRRNLNEGERKTQLQKLQEVIANDHPAVFLYSPDYLMVASKELRGVTSGFIPEPADRFRNAPDWHLNTARAFK